MVDVVITWVDDIDPIWREKKEYWQREQGRQVSKNDQERYRSWDNLHLLLRSIETNMSWINKVFLVTDDQVPSWIDTEHEKLEIVFHEDFIPKEYLPTFNSNVIELNLHRIENLSEKFILFNDDIFVLKETQKEDFFDRGLPRDNASMAITAPVRKLQINDILLNNLKIINYFFDRNETVLKNLRGWYSPKNRVGILKTALLSFWNVFPGFYEPHTANSYLKSTFVDVWEKAPEELMRTSKNKFRSDEDVNQWLMRYWQLASNQFRPRDVKFSKLFNLDHELTVNQCVSHILNKKTTLICINDSQNIEDFDKTKKTINDALNHLFPNKSKFEI